MATFSPGHLPFGISSFLKTPGAAPTRSHPYTVLKETDSTQSVRGLTSPSGVPLPGLQSTHLETRSATLCPVYSRCAWDPRKVLHQQEDWQRCLLCPRELDRVRPELQLLLGHRTWLSPPQELLPDCRLCSFLLLDAMGLHPVLSMAI